MRAGFVIPGDLATATGGYGYARRVLREAPKIGLALEHVGLPEGFPEPSPAALATAGELLSRAPEDVPLMIDGLAFAVLPEAMLRSCAAPMVALCHHPLALETGVSEAAALRLLESECRALGHAAHVITTSHATAQILMERFEVPGGKLTVAPPGTDPAPRGGGSGGDGCRILSVGSLTRRKGHDRLIRALARVPGDWTLRIAGPARDASYAEELAELIADEGLEGQITLLGALGAAELAAAYQSADLFALASEYEGFGMAFCEAMAHGLPVLGIESPAVEEATAGGARLVPPREFAPALARLIREDVDRSALAERCWTSAQTLLRWPQTTAIIAGVLRGVMR